MSQVVNTAALLALNPEYAEALARGDEWAVKHAARCDSLNRGEPEGMRREFDGKPRKWCGASCPNKKGCIVCTLPENHDMVKFNQTHEPYED
jgi:hypothetical protein